MDFDNGQVYPELYSQIPGSLYAKRRHELENNIEASPSISMTVEGNVGERIHREGCRIQYLECVAGLVLRLEDV